MRHSKSTIALATAGALGLASVPVVAQQIGDSGEPTEQTADESTSATDETDRPSDDAAEEDAPDTDARHRDGHGAWFGRFGDMVDDLSDDFAEELAAELGLDTEEVADAIDRVRERWIRDFEDTMAEHRAEIEDKATDHLDRAVEEDVLTQEQADALADLFANGHGFGPDRPDDLTDEQREALDALREWAGEQFGRLRGGPGFGPGGEDPRGWWGGDRGPDGDPEQGEDTPSGDATVQESALLTT